MTVEHTYQFFSNDINNCAQTQNATRCGTQLHPAGLVLNHIIWWRSLMNLAFTGTKQVRYRSYAHIFS